MAFLNYNKDEKLEFNYKRACGLWLIVVAVIISVAALTGGKQIINMPVFSIGYVISFFSINMNKKVLNRLSNGSSNKFQNKVSLYAIFLLFILKKGCFTMVRQSFFVLTFLLFRVITHHTGGKIEYERCNLCTILK